MATESKKKIKEEPEQAQTGAEVQVEKKKFVAKDLDPHMMVTVRNGFQGRLCYKSKRSGETWVWDSFGSEQELELQELRYAKNAAKSFFANNWFMFNDAWVVEYLGLKAYYRHAIRVEDFDKIFQKTPAQIEAEIGQMTKGQRQSVTYRAKELIANGEIDSNKVINTLEKALNVELVER